MATQTVALEKTNVPHHSFDTGDDKHYSDWIHTTVNYYKDTDESIASVAIRGLTEHEIRVQRRSDESPTIAPTPVRICNIKGHESDFKLETHGFTVGHLNSCMQDWQDDLELRQVYHPEVSELLKRETGAKYVFQYEWHVRTTTLEDALKEDSTGAVDIKGPVRRVHIDESPMAANKEYNHHIKPNIPANEHLAGRAFGIYNVWKPLKKVERDPLCLCDVRTVEDRDFHLTKVCVPVMGDIENISLRAPEAGRTHDFVYVRGQTPDQALIFRIYDNRIDGVVGSKRSYGVAHTSFVEPGTETAPPRESVEVRSFCVF
jgi:hypothetical protein